MQLKTPSNKHKLNLTTILLNIVLENLRNIDISHRNVRNTEYFNKTHAKARIGNIQPA